MQIAGDLFNVFPDGVYAVALSPLVSGEGLSLAILQALGLPPEPPADFRSQLLGSHSARVVFCSCSMTWGIYQKQWTSC